MARLRVLNEAQDQPTGKERLVAAGYTINPILWAACDAHGLALVPERLARPLLQDGRLRSCVDAYCRSFPGFHLYCPSRQRTSSAFQVLLDALRERG